MKWYQHIAEDFRSVSVRDPATTKSWWIITLHTGFWAVVAYRIQHALWEVGLHWLARFLSIFSRWITGVEIHPAVKAGRRLFLDHGMGIVIGETAILGDDVSIYQGVTLGGTSWQNEKRHPTIGSNVIIGAGAKVIGNIKVNDGARIGSNAVVVKDVPGHVTVVGVPAQVVNKSRSKSPDCEAFNAYAQSDDVVDPVMHLLEQLHERICRLEHDNERLAQIAANSQPLATDTAAPMRNSDDDGGKATATDDTAT